MALERERLHRPRHFGSRTAARASTVPLDLTADVQAVVCSVDKSAARHWEHRPAEGPRPGETIRTTYTATLPLQAGGVSGERCNRLDTPKRVGGEGS